MEEDLLQGAKAILQCHGLGGFKANTVLLGWSENAEAQSTCGRLLRLIHDFGRSLIIVRCKQEERIRWTSPVGTIDLWWRGGTNGALMLLLANLLIQNPDWHRNPIHILHVIAPGSGEFKVHEALNKMRETARVKATVEAVEDDGSLAGLKEKSRAAAVVMMSYNLPDNEEVPLFTPEVAACMDEFRNVLLVSSAGGISLVT